MISWNDINKFWTYVNKTENSCWLWTSYTTKDGYGSFELVTGFIRAHRLSWMLTNGLIPNNLSVLHKCDVRSCVNPDHLFLGTQDDNMKDCKEKGRTANFKGDLHPNSFLKDNQVIEILIKAATGKFTNKQLADEYKVSRCLIGFIINGKSWSHIILPEGQLDPRKQVKSNIKLLEKDVIEIRERYAKGDITMSKLAVIYGVKYQEISRIVNGLRWKNVGGPIISKK